MSSKDWLTWASPPTAYFIEGSTLYIQYLIPVLLTTIWTSFISIGCLIVVRVAVLLFLSVPSCCTRLQYQTPPPPLLPFRVLFSSEPYVPWSAGNRKVIGAMATIGALESAFLTYQKLNPAGMDLLCGASGGCLDVLNGPYSNVLASGVVYLDVIVNHCCFLETMVEGRAGDAAVVVGVSC